MSINKVTLIGNVGHTPKIVSNKEGTEFAEINLATSETWKDKQTGEKKENTEWHSIIVFVNSIVNFVKDYVNKGDKLYIEGSLKTNEYTGKDGAKKRATKIVLQGSNCILLKLNNRNEKNLEKTNLIDSEDIPF